MNKENIWSTLKKIENIWMSNWKTRTIDKDRERKWSLESEIIKIIRYIINIGVKR